MWVPWWVQRDSGFPSRWPWGFFSAALLPTTGSGQLVHPSHHTQLSHTMAKWPHHTQLSHTMVAYYQLLCQRAVVTSPHNTLVSLLLLLLFCLPLLEPHALLFNYPHVQILPKCSQQRFPLAAHACCPLLPLSTSATMGWFELCARQCVCAGNRDLAGKGQPKRHRGGDKRDARNREVRVGRIHPLGSCNIHLSVQPGFFLSFLLWCQTHTCKRRFAWVIRSSG